jgi:hypothetical protein
VSKIERAIQDRALPLTTRKTHRLEGTGLAETRAEARRARRAWPQPWVAYVIYTESQRDGAHPASATTRFSSRHVVAARGGSRVPRASAGVSDARRRPPPVPRELVSWVLGFGTQHRTMRNSEGPRELVSWVLGFRTQYATQLREAAECIVGHQPAVSRGRNSPRHASRTPARRAADFGLGQPPREVHVRGSADLRRLRRICVQTREPRGKLAGESSSSQGVCFALRSCSYR